MAVRLRPGSAGPQVDDGFAVNLDAKGGAAFEGALHQPDKRLFDRFETSVALAMDSKCTRHVSSTQGLVCSLE
ncbi:hypothetical protein D3C86_2182610 [compost metagenome]